MNTPLHDDNANLRYAEYVLGVLDADARAAVARDVRTNEQAATAVALWESRLLPLSEDVAPSDPPPYVWARIRHALQLDVSTRRTDPVARPRLWNNLRFWQGLGLGAGVLAAGCLVLLLTPARHAPLPIRPAIPYMASTIVQSDGHVGWTATMDIQQARIVVVPVTPQGLTLGRAPELWLIPEGKKPIAVGMIDSHNPTTLTLDRAQLAHVGPTAVLAVSVEPVGGSPTGQPTGPVIAKGAIGAAPENGSSVKSVTLRFTPSHGRRIV
ncbi:hypothetical protein GCM10007862_10030 [Dyella lipolytica]|uniref:Anti-sigma factor n=1 Tax=Dyella lipolytica TaxID=1867835 RepID=A0ABW8IXU2_9GAMM|nr:anti-sigma factor [Dyella lipolytica]GLQ45952.1 hypothetical protein GCM10007862_10030 [Dyella lipolytica]